jgi:DNA helicase-2/ATP-dependent DNA helicase PcrA
MLLANSTTILWRGHAQLVFICILLIFKTGFVLVFGLVLLVLLFIIFIMNYLQELNEVQRGAVMDIAGPVMIIAGPGSGKTRVLTYRVAYMLQQRVDAFNILCLTFTNKAAHEMRERVSQLCGGEGRNLWMGTFHSIFARVLRAEGSKLGYPNNFTIYDTDDSKQLIRQLIRNIVPPDKQKLYKEGYVYNRISSAKNSLIGPGDYAQNTDLISEDSANYREKMSAIYSAYAAACFQNGAMDFDDLLFKMYELLERFPDVALRYQHKFKYIMIDEFQDTNYAQYEVIKKLASMHENLCVVGDDAQSIYAFRGATIQNIIQFETQFPDMKKYKLEQNYRSTPHIVAAANSVISNNKFQLDKTIFTEREAGMLVTEIKANSDNDEGKQVVDRIFELKMRQHYHNRDIAILYRTNAQSRSFEESLRRMNIAYRIYGGISFYQRKEIKDFIGYLRLVVNPSDAEALKRIINYPIRGIGATSINKLIVLADERGISLWEAINQVKQLGFVARAAADMETFAYLIRSFQTMLAEKNAYEVASHIAQQTGILRELHNDKSIEGLSRFENLNELLNSIKEFTENDEVITDEAGEIATDRSLGAYLQQITLLTDADRNNDADQNVVRLMTIHAAKGLEFGAVFVVGLEENLFPSMMSVSSRFDLEEERRLFYVAITRAKDCLFLSHASSRYRYGRLEYGEPSRFLEEIDDANMARVNARPSYTPTVPKEHQASTNVFSSVLSQKIFKPNTPVKIDPNFAPTEINLLKASDRVRHQKFGEGNIVSIDGAGDSKVAVITFDTEGEKRLMLKFAKVMLVE